MDRRERTHAELHERLGGADLVHVVTEAADRHDVETESADAALRQVGDGLREVEAEEVRGGLGRHGRVAHIGADQKQDEPEHQKDNGRIVVFDDEVRKQHDGQERTNDSEHLKISGQVVSGNFGPGGLRLPKAEPAC